MPNMAKNFLLWAVIAAVLMMVFDNFQNTATDKELSYSEFITAVETNQVEKVTITGQSIVGIERGGNRFETIMPTYDDKLIDTLLANDVQVKGTKPEKQSFLAQLLIASLPIIIIIAYLCCLCVKCRAVAVVKVVLWRLVKARPSY